MSGKRILLASCVIAFFCEGYAQNVTKGKYGEKTIFQTSSPWKPDIDIRSDAAVIYGIKTQEQHKLNGVTMNFEQRAKTWKDKGYQTYFMTGISWGEYQDYFSGEWDGKEHFDEGQKRRNGEIVWHNPGVPYIVPTCNFLKYLKEKHVKVAIDTGMDVLFFEEPEFWAFAGYSDAFKREWKEYYGFDWRPQDASAENLYLSNKLKYHLYSRAVDECCTYAKEYGESLGRDIRCYIPTHSLVNYSQWRIVSPEASLASLPCVDGYIAQVWTGTARTANFYNGKLAERGFEGAFIEYGSVETMTAPTGRKVFFLADPVEDYPRDWADYTYNYQATFIAKLFYPNNNNYEVMPWPERVYEWLFPVSATSSEKARIPRSFSTQLQVMINTLNDMPVSDNKVSGTQGINVLMGNSLMFQRNDTLVEGYDDPELANFFGMVMPLLKRGIPVKTLHIENTAYPETWKDTRTLVMSYTNMKPLTSGGNECIAKWVKNGGNLIYVSRDRDPFQTAYEWWNTGSKHYDTPSGHLFSLLGIGEKPVKVYYQVGKGTVQILRYDPKAFVLKEDNDGPLLTAIEKVTQKVEYKNNLVLDRGPYRIIAVMNESVSDEPYVTQGLFIDLFDPKLPVVTEKKVAPGTQSFLYNVETAFNYKQPQVLASAARISDESRSGHSYSFIAKSPSFTTNVMRVWLPKKPKKVIVWDANSQPMVNVERQWDERSQTYFLGFENSPDGIRTTFTW